MAKKQIQSLPKSKKKVNRVKRTDIGFINEHGLEITFEEQEEFRQLVNRAKRKAKTITSKYDGSYHNYAKPYLNHSTSIGEYKNRDAFESQIKSLKAFTSRDTKKYFALARKEDMLLSLDHLGYGINSQLNSETLNENEVSQLKKAIKSMNYEQLLKFWDDGQSFFEDVYKGDIDAINDKLDTLNIKAKFRLNERQAKRGD